MTNGICTRGEGTGSRRGSSEKPAKIHFLKLDGVEMPNP